MSERYLTIHGHFYQPPRENPWLEAIELQDSAYPYHDWNERILSECYAPNGTSRILNEQGQIVQIVNNYSKISFNIGPTLLSWMEEKSPHTYQDILEADRLSQEKFSGHGSAIAQVYNHAIMPLAHPRDKFTQVFWGIKDFESRFNRKPEGIWLAETAVDTATLEVLAELGIKFTILAPHQAARVRKMGGGRWKDVSNASIDPTQPYLIHLPSGRSLSLFFYDGPISRAVAFERLLEKGETFANRLMTGFSNQEGAELVHIATDGETYGHHHRFGDMALAYALNHIEQNNLAKLTNYSEYLEKFPPSQEVQIVENSSWSCAHGVERWKADCGCRLGMGNGWNQAWRGPLRDAFDWLRDEIAPLYEKEPFKDPWMARNDYIELVLDRSPERMKDFVDRYASKPLNDEERIRMLKLLEMQRQLLLMYTSCGWFFDELSGIETVQVIQYAGRAIQLAEQLFGRPFEPAFLEKLERAKSNIPEHKDGRRVYDLFVNPAGMDLRKVGAHYAISSVFENGLEEPKTYCYDIHYDDYKSFVAGKARLVVGQIQVTSEITMESENLMFAILHMGDHNINGGIGPFTSSEAYQAMVEEMAAAFKKADFSETVRAIDRTFGKSIYTLKSLFRDEQRKIFSSILETTLEDAEAVLRQVYENNAPLMRYLASLMMPLPKAMQSTAEFTLNMNLKRAVEADEFEVDRIRQVLGEIKEARITLDKAGLAYAVEKSLARLMEQAWADPDDSSLLSTLVEAIELVDELPFEVNLWNVQNNYYDLLQRIYPKFKERGAAGDDVAKQWIKSFIALGEKLQVKVV